MVSKVPIPFFPQPPSEYDSGYISQIVRSFALYTEQQNAGGEARFTTITVTNLPSYDNETTTGDLFERDGFLKITDLSRPHPPSIGSTGSVGSVSVTIS